MSWLSQGIHKIGDAIRGGSNKPPLTVGTVVGSLARPVGEGVTEWMARIGGGQPAGAAATATAKTKVAAATNTVVNGVNVAREGLTVSSAFSALMQGPTPWILIGLALAVLVSRGKK